ncbi:MAG: glycine cleavage system protein GcvH [Simkaniaceae bacterium]|nr:glycine cleavage system protein GcvH [Candidatus Sacchlamyda saccharinae]
MKFSDTHEWARLEGETVVVGITEYAQKELGEVVYVQLPEVGQEVKGGVEVVILESTKAASDIYSPVSGIITVVNEKVKEDPSLLNHSAEKEGWLFKIAIKDRSELDTLLDQEQYLTLIS